MIIKRTINTAVAVIPISITQPGIISLPIITKNKYLWKVNKKVVCRNEPFIRYITPNDTLTLVCDVDGRVGFLWKNKPIKINLSSLLHVPNLIALELDKESIEDIELLNEYKEVGNGVTRIVRKRTTFH